MLKKHLWEIFEVAEKHGVATQSAEDMFRGDLRAGTGENTGLDLDWPALAREWAELGHEGQAEANREVAQALASKSALLASAWIEGDRARFEAILYPPEAAGDAGEQEESGQA